MLFDSWKLDKSKRVEFINILTNKNADIAAVSLKYNTSWPLAVGHYANSKLNSEHSKQRLDEHKRIESETIQKLIDLVGLERVNEFYNRNVTKLKNNDDN